MASPFRSGKSGRLTTATIRKNRFFGLSKRIASRFFGDPTLASSISDDFNDNSIDSTKWVNSNATQIVEISQQLQITTTLPAAYFNLASKEFVSLEENEVKVKVVNAGNQSLASLEVYPMQLVELTTLGSFNAYMWLISNGSIYVFRTIKGVSTNLFSTAYASGTHVYFRIRESAGLVYFDTSVDGTSWTNRHTRAKEFNLKQIKPTIIVGTYAAEASATTVIFDDWNVSSAGGSFSQSCLETITLVDINLRTTSRRLIEAIPLVDTVRKLPSRTLIDALVLVDSVIKTASRFLIDSLVLVDTVAGKITARLLTDALTLVDTITKSTSRIIIDTLILVDTTIRTITRSFIDSLTLVDTFAGFKITVKNLIDSLVLVDNVTKLTSRTLSDALILVDNLQRTTTRLITEALVLVDTMTKVTGRSLIDALVLVDTIAKTTSRRLIDSAILVDNVIRTTTRRFIDSLTLVDTFTFSRVIVRAYTETLILADSIQKTTSKIARETLTLIDTFLSDLITLTVRSIGNWIVYGIGGLMKVVRMERKTHALSTVKEVHVVLLSERSFTASPTQTTHTSRSNTTP